MKKKLSASLMCADLLNLENMECIAAVPVGLTDHRDGLAKLQSFNKKSAENVLDIIDEYAQKSIEKYGDRRIYGSDEFYLLSERDIPNAEFYGDFLQLENGVGLSALLKSEVYETLEYMKELPFTVNPNIVKVSDTNITAIISIIYNIDEIANPLLFSFIVSPSFTLK